MSYSILDLLCLLGAVGLFLYGMKVMSEACKRLPATACETSSAP